MNHMYKNSTGTNMNMTQTVKKSKLIKELKHVTELSKPRNITIASQ